MTIHRKDFLFEIGTEELPAKQLVLLQDALRTGLVTQLQQAQLDFEGVAEVFATPRRLAILIPKLQTMQQAQTIERKGPSVTNAFDGSGAPTKACLGFAESFGVAASALTEKTTAQGTFLFATKIVPGQSAQALLPDIIKTVLNGLPIAKPMHWGAHPQAFLRSVHWIVLLLGEEVIPAVFFDIQSSHFSYGHRFLAPQKIKIAEAKSYPDLMRAAYVITNLAERKTSILQSLNEMASDLGGQVLMNETLLDEVVGLVEWPVVLAGHFDYNLLSMPHNALIAAMETHQKSFAVVNKEGKLLPHFLIISNLKSKDPSKIIQGNERVMHARLSDAQFFYEKDCAIPLQNHCADLARVTFQAQLGSLEIKSKALAELAAEIARQLGFDEGAAGEVGLLAKCDLRTHMVGEFPELQGQMGEIYARKQGLPEDIACALSEQYLPRFASDQLPASATGIALALADRLLNLVGLFGVGQIPTGSKDPFALRRAAIGVCRIILEKKLILPLKTLLILAQSSWVAQGVNFDISIIQDRVYDFIIERLRQIYFEQGVSAQIIESVLCLGLDDLTDIDGRIQAIKTFVTLPAAKSVAASEKRVRNLLQKENILSNALGLPDQKLFELPEEHLLFDALIEVQANTVEAALQKNYPFILEKTAALKQPIDNFFDRVMVMVEDSALRHNRLALLCRFSCFSNQVADISKLVV